MDNEKFKNEPDDSWLDELFGAIEEKAELAIDEVAMDSHDMGQISDRELDQIIKETMSDDWNIEDFEPVFDDPMPVETPRVEYADNGEEIEYTKSTFGTDLFMSELEAENFITECGY